VSVPAEVAAAIVAAGRRLDALGLVPATAGNFSVRLDGRRLAVTVSGRHKGFLTPDDVMVVDLDGMAEDPAKRSSAETILHCGIYRRFPEAGAVLHGHSIANTVLSRRGGGALTLAGYELLKAFPGLPPTTPR
jgi:methylthioribulose-1-phosphate dehydratase